MVSTDPVSDMLTRIRNAALVQKGVVSMPHSNLKEAVARILKAHNYVTSVEVSGSNTTKQLVIEINNISGITEVKRLSKPGRRLYSNADGIPTVKGGRGLIIISTSKGVMTGKDAKHQRLGGELLCQVY